MYDENIGKKKMEAKSKKYQVLSNSMLKILAVITMLIDHVALVFRYRFNTVFLTVAGKSFTCYEIMRFIGRWSFPVYAFLISEGFVHTRNRKMYGLRLLIFAFLSEIPWNLEHTGTFYYEKQNVYFTLFLGYLSLCLTEEIRKGKETLRNQLLLLGLLLICFVLNADYGYSGFCFIILMYLLRDSLVLRAVSGISLLSCHWKAVPAFAAIGLYNGKRGFINNRFLQICFYTIYPLHMLIFYFIKKSLGGY